jgi:hypothetical protein
MSKSSSRSRPSESVFGALGPDDAYFGNRVQAAARDAQQRWPLLGGMAPTASDETPALSEDDKARWQPQPPLVQSKPAISRPSLSKKLESGLGRLTAQTRTDDQLSSRRARPSRETQDFADTEPHPATRVVRAAPTQPAPLAEEPAFAPRPRATRDTPARGVEASAPVSRPRAQPVPAAAPKDDKSLGGVFRRLANQAGPAPSGASDAPRKSILGRLGKR